MMGTRNPKDFRAPKGRILPPLGGCVSKLFKSRKSFFLTLNPYKKHQNFTKFQQIGKVYDRLRRQCDRLFMVRESYKEGGFHYHAIVSGYKPKPIKGLRVHCQDIGPKGKKPTFDPTVEPKHCVGAIPNIREFPTWWNYNPVPIMDWVYFHISKQKEKMINRSTALRARARQKVRKTNLDRVIAYILKEDPQHLYTDWISNPKIQKV